VQLAEGGVAMSTPATSRASACRQLLLLLLLPPSVVLAQGRPAPARTPVPPRFSADPEDYKMLFVDHALFAELTGDIGLRRHRPSPAGEIVLRPDKPWESFGYIGYHTVLQMGPGDYRLYYDTGWTMVDRDDFHRYTCLALSTDGRNWTKPNLGLANFNGSKANNIVWPLDWQDNTHAAGTVFIDTNPSAPADARFKMVAQWTGASGNAGVWMMKSPDGIAFSPMFADRSLAWSDTKNVMWWDSALSKYVAYIRIDKMFPDVHKNDPCTVWPGPGRSIGRCLIGAEQLHDWSLAGCNSAGTGATANVLTFDEDDPSCLDIYTNSATKCKTRGAPVACRIHLQSPCTAVVVCQILTPSSRLISCAAFASPYGTDETGGGGGIILFFPSTYQHIMFPPATSPSKNNNGLVDIRFATARHVLDACSYPPTRDGRAPFVPLGVNSCPILTLAPRTWPSRMAGDAPRFDWCCTCHRYFLSARAWLPLDGALLNGILRVAELFLELLRLLFVVHVLCA
jgi:hypothetical protein